MVKFLPPYEDLTKEQDRALRYQGSLLVTGPPGSGKTVIALFRANELKRSKRKAHILTYGKVLMSFITKCLEEAEVFDIEKSTFHTWFPKYYRCYFKSNPPKCDTFTFDWVSIEKKFLKEGFCNAFDQLIIDEAQDLPVEFLRLSPYISKGVTVFADENQAIFENNTTIDKIERALKRFNPNHIKLRKNFRNTKQIARFSSFFKTDGIATGKTDLPDREGALPILCNMKDQEEQLDRICSYLPTIKSQNKTVGIFLPKKTDIRNWKKKLSGKVKGLKVQYYLSGEKVNGRWLGAPDFSKKGIFIVSDWTAKGLEFDYVFIPDMQSLNDEISQVMRCYVAFSRAKDMLVMMYSGDRIPKIIKNKIDKYESDFTNSIEIDKTKNKKTKKTQKLKRINNQNKMNESILIKDFIDFCKDELNESSYLRLRKLSPHIFTNKTGVYSASDVKKVIERNFPGKMKRDLLIILKNYSKNL